MNAGNLNEHGVILIERFLLKHYKVLIYDEGIIILEMTSKKSELNIRQY